MVWLWRIEFKNQLWKLTFTFRKILQMYLIAFFPHLTLLILRSWVLMTCKCICYIRLRNGWVFIGRTDVERLQYFGYLMRRADSFEKTLMLGKIEGRRRGGQQRMRWLDGITDSMDMSLSKLRSWWWTGRPGMLRFMGSQRVRHNWVTELNWAECLMGRTHKEKCNKKITLHREMCLNPKLRIT